MQDETNTQASRADDATAIGSPAPAPGDDPGLTSAPPASLLTQTQERLAELRRQPLGDQPAGYAALHDNLDTALAGIDDA